MSRKYDSAASRSETHQSRLNKLAQRFDSLEDELGRLEAKIETELPKLGISVSPLGNRRKGILADGVSPKDVSLAEGNLIDSGFSENDLADLSSVDPSKSTKSRRRAKPR